MSTPNSPIPAARRAGARAWAIAAALLTAGTLAAGCGTTPAGAPSGGSTPTVSATAASAASAASSASAASAPAVPSGSAVAPGSTGSSEPAAPVPTVTGGPVTPGEPACAGWPAGARRESLPASFVPVAVERCLDGEQTIPGKGVWQTASLQRADSGLDALVSALHQPRGTHQPDTACPMLAIIPPQVVLISATGQDLIPQLPVTGCGIVQSGVLAALDTLPWRLVSVRLIAAVPGASSTGNAP